MSRRTIPGSRALVTGASSGIGRALALELSKQGADVVVVARREERLRELAAQIEKLGRRAVVVVGDVTQPATREAAVQSAKENLGGLDLLINNAGVGALGPFRDADAERLQKIFAVNFFAMAELTRLALPVLAAGNQPMIVNIGSILGHLSLPNMSEYCASKFAIRGFTNSLRAELVPQGIDVLLVSPATTETEIWETMLERKAEPVWKAAKGATPDFVARKTVAAIRKGKHELFPGMGPKFLNWVTRLWPSAVAWVVGRGRR